MSPFLKYVVEDSFHVVLLGHVAAIGFRVAPGRRDFADYHLGRHPRRCPARARRPRYWRIFAATARPMPLAPPVTTASLPSRRKVCELPFRKDLPVFDSNASNLLDLLLMRALKHC